MFIHSPIDQGRIILLNTHVTVTVRGKSLVNNEHLAEDHNNKKRKHFAKTKEANDATC